VICKPTGHYLEDGSAASEHILLAAHAHGLGACWVAGEKEGWAKLAKNVHKLIYAQKAFIYGTQTGNVESWSWI